MKLVNAEETGLVNMLGVGDMSQNFVAFCSRDCRDTQSAESTAGTLGGQTETFDRSKRKAMNRNWSNQKANPALKTKTGNK